MKLIFIGTSEFGAVVLEKLAKSEFGPVLVITAPDKPAGRKLEMTPPPVKSLLMEHETWNIPILQPEKIQDSRFKIQDSRPDLIVVAAYGQIIPKEILEIPKYGGLNVHPSLLPRWRGASPVQYTILNGDEETGVTIILMDEKMDHGPVLAKRELEILNPKSQFPNPDWKSRILDSSRDKLKILNSKPTYQQLHNKLAEIGAELLIETIPKWLIGEIKPTPQDESKATYTKILKKEGGRIDWQKSAEEIERQIRAFNPWPGTFALFKIKNQKSKIKIESQNSKVLKILQADTLSSNSEKQVGKVFQTENGKIAAQCGQNALILLKIQIEGGKPMDIKNFIRGHRDFIGTILS